jgi:hypothetical protein
MKRTILANYGNFGVFAVSYRDVVTPDEIPVEPHFVKILVLLRHRRRQFRVVVFISINYIIGRVKLNVTRTTEEAVRRPRVIDEQP